MHHINKHIKYKHQHEFWNLIKKLKTLSLLKNNPKYYIYIYIPILSGKKEKLPIQLKKVIWVCE
jgi:hypothetical protein